METFMGPFLFGVFLYLIYFIFRLLISGFRRLFASEEGAVIENERVCAWCGSDRISFQSGTPGKYFWEYRNKDGSRDKRVTGNFLQASFSSKFHCSDCSARTGFLHFVSKNPSEKVNIASRYLLEDGEGDRLSVDWNNPNVQKVNRRSARRKGD